MVRDYVPYIYSFHTSATHTPYLQIYSRLCHEEGQSGSQRNTRRDENTFSSVSALKKRRQNKKVHRGRISKTGIERKQMRKKKNIHEQETPS
jgi:hypothetical protein